jgi:hypothetical protein
MRVIQCHSKDVVKITFLYHLDAEQVRLGLIHVQHELS